MSTDTPEPGEDFPRQRVTVDLAGLDESALKNVSILVGGSGATIAEAITDIRAVDTLILPWGDDRLEGILAWATEASGYPYGAEGMRVAIVVDDWIVQANVIPHTPFDQEAVTDDEGNISALLLGLHEPTFNPGIDFIDWNSDGLAAMRKHLLEGSSKRTWVKLADYDLDTAMAMNTSGPYVVRMLH